MNDLDAPAGSDEQPGFFDIVWSASHEKTAKDLFAHLVHLKQRSATNRLFCDLFACRLLEDHEAIPGVIEKWLKRQGELKKTPFWNMTEEQKEGPRLFAEGILYALWGFIKREGVGPFLAELQNFVEDNDLI